MRADSVHILVEAGFKLAYASDSIKPPALAGVVGKQMSSRMRATDRASSALAYASSSDCSSEPPAKAGALCCRSHTRAKTVVARSNHFAGKIVFNSQSISAY
jgi:hypothetical protein